MDVLTPEQIEEIYQRLPQDIKTALFSEINALFIRQAAARFNVPPEKISILAGTVGDVMMGILPLSEFAANLQDALGLGPQAGQALAQEIDFKIFSPIRRSLRRVQGLATPEELALEAATKITAMPSPAIPGLPAAVRPPAVPSAPAIRPPAVPPRPAAAPPVSATPARVAPPPSLPTATPAPRPIAPVRPAVPVPTPAPAALPTSGTIRPMPPAPAAPRPAVPPFSRLAIPGMARPYIPTRPSATPGVFLPKTITPPTGLQRPAYEAPALSQKTISSPPAGGPAATPATPKPMTATPAESIDLTRVSAEDTRLKGNVVDLKDLE